jgi:hypothetical protein
MHKAFVLKVLDEYNYCRHSDWHWIEIEARSQSGPPHWPGADADVSVLRPPVRPSPAAWPASAAGSIAKLVRGSCGVRFPRNVGVPAWCGRSRAGLSGGGCAARAPTCAVTGSRVAEDVPGVHPSWRRGS